MFIYIHIKTKSVIYFADYEQTYLQTLEGPHLAGQWVASLPQGMNRSNCTNWAYIDTFTLQAPTPEALLLNRKCHALNRAYTLCQQARAPFNKNNHQQDFIYERKYNQAVRYLDGGSKDELLAELPYLRNEIAVTKLPPVTVALAIRRRRLERDEILLASEKARRYFDMHICRATAEQLGPLIDQLVLRNFKLDMEV